MTGNKLKDAIRRLAADMQYDKAFSPQESHIIILYDALTRLDELEREAAIDKEQCDTMTELAADFACKLVEAEKDIQNLEQSNQVLRRGLVQLETQLVPGKCYAVYQDQSHNWKRTEASGYSLAFGANGDEQSTIKFIYEP